MSLRCIYWAWDEEKVIDYFSVKPLTSLGARMFMITYHDDASVPSDLGELC